LYNSKVGEEKAVAIAEHLADGCSLEATARLTGVDSSTVERMNRMVGRHGQAWHEQEVRELQTTSLQADERHGFAGNKKQVVWEAEVIDLESKLVVAHEQGARDEALVRRLLEGAARRLRSPRHTALFTDGLPSYKTLFPQVFGYPWYPPRQGKRGRYPQPRFRVPRTAAHVQVVKHMNGRRLDRVEVCHAHGSRKRIDAALKELGWRVPNTSTIERRNGTARLMIAANGRRTLAFAGRHETKMHLGWWGVTVYNWCRAHRSLKQKLAQPKGRKLYEQRSPAMAAGLTNSIMSIREVLLCQVHPPGGWR
jgi:IS1 family transposase